VLFLYRVPLSSMKLLRWCSFSPPRSSLSYGITMILSFICRLILLIFLNTNLGNKHWFARFSDDLLLTEEIPKATDLQVSRSQAQTWPLAIVARVQNGSASWIQGLFKKTEIESGIIDLETYRMRSDNMRKKARRCKLKRVSIPPERGIREGSGRKTEREKCWHNYKAREKKKNIVKLVTGTDQNRLPPPPTKPSIE